MKLLLLLVLLVSPLFGQLIDMPHTPRNIQSPYVAADFWAQWSSANPRMCLCVLVTPQVGTAVAFTSNTRPMTLPGHPGVTFKATPAITPTAIEMGLDEAVNLEMTGVYNSDSFVQEDVIAGKWNFAAVEVFCVCWDNVNLGEFLVFKGNTGEVKDYQTFYNAELRSNLARLSNDVSMATSRFCRIIEFRNALCGHTAATVTVGGVAYNVTQTGVTGTPVSVGDQRYSAFFNSSTFAGNDPIEADFPLWLALWANGKITATDGPNTGISREIAGVSEATGGYPYLLLNTKRPFPFPIDTSTTFNLVMGCNRTIEDCMKFGNIVNRRSEDYVPGLETANRITTTN